MQVITAVLGCKNDVNNIFAVSRFAATVGDDRAPVSAYSAYAVFFVVNRVAWYWAAALE